MFAGKLFKGSLLAATVVAEATAVAEAQLLSHKHEEPLCRPSELPIYTPEPEPTAQRLKEIQEEDAPSFIEQSVKNVRTTVFQFKEEAVHIKQVALDEIDKQQENMESLIHYLREEDNTMPKAGAIGIGALAGLVLGLRGGFIKKTIYASTGALGMAALCYPKEAHQYSEVGIREGKKYLTIAYNFVYGVKKDDPPLELPKLPQLPSSFEEVWGSIKNTATSFVSDEKKSEQADGNATK